MILLLSALLFGAVTSMLMPEEAAQIQVIDAVEAGDENIFIKVNGFHKDTKDSVYMQVDLAIGISEGLVTVNNQILPLKELKSFQVEAQITELADGISNTPFTDSVTIHLFLHKESIVDGDDVSRTLSLECQIIETDRYDVHMINVTEIVMEIDNSQMELRRSVTMISEEESRLHQARNCPMLKCRAIDGCIDWKKNQYGCQTCTCSAMEETECLSSCVGVCPGDSQLDEAVEDKNGCWICPCLVIDDFTPRQNTLVSCGRSYGMSLIHKFNELPFLVRIMIILLLSVLSVVLTITCCITVCCRKRQNQKTNNLKTFGFGKLQIYVPDNEKKVPLIDNLDVVSADIA